MSTTLSRRSTATITIHADYLEDVRGALVAGISNDSAALRTDHDAVLRGSSIGREDRAAAVRILRADVHLLDQVLDETDSTTVTGEWDAVVHLLEDVTRVLSGQLTEACGYAPVEMDAALTVAERLRWAADEYARLYADAGEIDVEAAA